MNKKSNGIKQSKAKNTFLKIIKRCYFKILPSLIKNVHFFLFFVCARQIQMIIICLNKIKMLLLYYLYFLSCSNMLQTLRSQYLKKIRLCIYTIHIKMRQHLIRQSGLFNIIFNQFTIGGSLVLNSMG